LSSGAFEERETRVVTETTQSKQAFKDYLETPVRYRAHLDFCIYLTMMFIKRERDNRVRTLCVENMSGSVLQMLGTVYGLGSLLCGNSAIKFLQI
jgi:hypothetical protein